MLETMWPVGQAVKTAASHAANMGSIPVRVTTQKQAPDRALPADAESLLPTLLFRSVSQTLRWFAKRCGGKVNKVILAAEKGGKERRVLWKFSLLTFFFKRK